jgi:hypothetical protein
VIRLTFHYPESSVYLLKENDPHELMGKSQGGEAEFFICPRKDCP